MGLWKKLDGKLQHFKNEDELFEVMTKRAPIKIKKSHEGDFTAKAKAAGMSVQAYATKVLNDKNADPATKKQANFARNAKRWNS